LNALGVKRAGLLGGPLLAIAVYLLLPEAYSALDGRAVALPDGGRATLAVMAWMAAWWLTEAIDVSATALLPIAVFPLLGILPISAATAPYASDLIFLFLGGFVLALSMQRWGLDRRIALLTLRVVGSKPSNIIGGFMVVTAGLSMWVSNTATAAMMLPIALSVIALVLQQEAGHSLAESGMPPDGVPGRNFALSLLLAIAYAASIGGIATIIGSPPNGIVVQFLAQEYQRDISFADWLLIGGPVTLVFLPIAWLLITWVLYPIRIREVAGGQALFAQEAATLGPMRSGEWVTLLVFLCTALLWITRPLLSSLSIGDTGWRPLAGLSDAGIAILAAMALFVIPVRNGREAGAPRTFTMTWQAAVELPWGILILFGGGLSLAAAVQANQVAEFLGAQASVLAGFPTIVLVLAVTTGVIFLTELTSNTATTATLVPVLAGMASGLAVTPEMLVIPAAIAASCAFMMPVATPPNAIVFGAGYITVPQMAWAGLWLNLIGVAVITGLLYAVVLPLLAAPTHAPDGDWAKHGHGDAEQRYSPLSRIHAGNVDELGLAWHYDTGEHRGHEATPLVVDGVMYLTTPWSIVHALDAATGRRLWRFDPEVAKAWGRYACCDVVNRGVAFWQGHVFVGTLDGRLIKLDAATGSPMWEIDTIGDRVHYTITGAPRVVKGQVIIGNGGAEFGVRGYVSAYDAGSGELTWRFWTVPGDPAQPFEHPELAAAAATWSGEWWHIGGGGTVWDSMAYDPTLDLLYVGTGNGSPWSRTHRSPGGGDNLFLSSILALDPDDGRLVWHYQTTPGDNWDYTATQHIVLADLTIDGRPRQVLMQAPKNGFFYVLDRASGELISAEPYARVTWASHVDRTSGRPVESAEGNYDEGPRFVFPPPTGAHNWQPMAFHPGTGLVYLPSRDAAGIYGFEEDFQAAPGTFNTGTFVATNAREHLGEAPPSIDHLLAWDPIAQQARWQVTHSDDPNGGLLATAGGLVFQGTADGTLVAYAADDGRPLWKAETRIGILAPPISYQVDGDQYISVVAGMGGAGLPQAERLRHLQNPGRVFAFRLGGGAAMPVVPEKVTADPSLPERFGDPGRIAKGETLYRRHCQRCHGADAESRGLVRDLRFAAPGVHEQWNAIVLQGAYGGMGMAGFADILDAEQAEAIRSYVVERAYATRR
jgi:quinohemoprotein ethanol dehydrogenase